MLINSSAGFWGLFVVIMILCSILKLYGWQIGGVVNILPSSAELSINIPEFYWWFQDDVCNIAGSCFFSGLIIYVYEMSVTPYVDNSISRSPF